LKQLAKANFPENGKHFRTTIGLVCGDYVIGRCVLRLHLISHGNLLWFIFFCSDICD